MGNYVILAVLVVVGAAGILNGLRKRNTDTKNKTDKVPSFLFTIAMMILSIVIIVEIGISFMLLISIVLFVIGIFMIIKGR